MCIALLEREQINNSDYNFIVTNSILNKTGEFKCEDVIDEISSYKIKIDNLEMVVKSIIIKLSENGVLEQLGSYYSVMNNGDSRWLHFGK